MHCIERKALAFERDVSLWSRFAGLRLFVPLQPGGPAMLEGCPFRLPAKPRRKQVEKMPDGVKRPSARQFGLSRPSWSEPKLGPSCFTGK